MRIENDGTLLKNLHKMSLRGPKGRGNLLRHEQESYRRVWDCFASLAMTEFGLISSKKYKTVNWDSNKQANLKKQTQFSKS